MPVSPFRRAVAQGLVAPIDADESASEGPEGGKSPISGKKVTRGIGRPSAEQARNWVPVFLDALRSGSTVKDAAREAGVDSSLPYHRRRDDPALREAWREAAELGTELLEMEAIRRAYHGVPEPVFYKGKIVGSTRQYSDLLMMFLLKARRPEVYRDISEQGRGSTINVSVQTNVTAAEVLKSMVARDGEVLEVQGLSETLGVGHDGGGGSQAPGTPGVAGAPGDGGQRGEMDAGAPPEENKFGPGPGLEDT